MEWVPVSTACLFLFSHHRFANSDSDSHFFYISIKRMGRDVEEMGEGMGQRIARMVAHYGMLPSQFKLDKQISLLVTFLAQSHASASCKSASRISA